MKINEGTTLGHYEIRSQIGAGGMGEVYLAEDTKLDRKVALEGRGDRHREAQAVTRARRMRLVRRSEQAVEMGRVLDRRAGIVAARMPRHLVGADDQPDGGRVGQQRERLADVGVRNRVAVAIEADVRECAGDDRPHQVGLEGMRGPR